MGKWSYYSTRKVFMFHITKWVTDANKTQTQYKCKSACMQKVFIAERLRLAGTQQPSDVHKQKVKATRGSLSFQVRWLINNCFLLCLTCFARNSTGRWWKTTQPHTSPSLVFHGGLVYSSCWKEDRSVFHLTQNTVIDTLGEEIIFAAQMKCVNAEPDTIAWVST